MKSSSSSDQPSTRKCGCRKKLMIGLFVAVLLYVLLGFFAVPPIVRAVANSQVEKNLHAQLEMESVSFNPFTLRLKLANIALLDLKGNDVLRLGEGEFAVSLSSILHFAPVMREVLLDKPTLFLSRSADGEINVLQLLKEEPEDPNPNTEIPKLAIQHLSLTRGAIHLEDEDLREPASLLFVPIAFDLEDFSTFSPDGSELRFSAKSVSGGSVEGTGSFNVDPIAATVDLALQRFDIAAFSSYIREFVDVDLREGLVGLQLTAKFQSNSEAEMITGNLASLVLSDLHLYPAGEKTAFLSLGEVEIRNARFGAWEPRLDVESVTITDGNAKIRRLENGNIDLLELLSASEPSPAAPNSTDTDAPAEPFPFSFSVAAVDLHNFDFSVTDLATAENALLTGRLDQLELRSLSEDFSQPVPFSLKGVLLEDGRFELAGNMTPLPLGGEIDITVATIPLTPFNPWAAAFTDLSLHSGNTGLNGKISLTSGSDPQPIVTFDGTITAREFAAHEGENPILGFDQFDITGLALKSEPLSVQADLVHLTAPQANVVLESDGNLNLLRLLRLTSPDEETDETTPAPENSPATPAESSPADDLAISYVVNRIQLEKGTVAVTDQTITPAYSTQLQNLAVEVTDLTSKPDNRSKINVSGDFPSGSHIQITGTTNAQPAELFADMTVALTGFTLPPVSPYSGQFIGRTVSGGSLNFKVSAKVENETLSANNSILLKNFRLGERVESPSAPSLPLDLALALLRDGNDEISLDIPLSGQLNDPQFSIASIATTALFTVIRNVATSPFSVLGNLVGGKSETDLSEVTFAIGQTELSEENRETLRQLAAALHQRPALKLEINAFANPATEEPILRNQRLRDELLTHQKETEAATTDSKTDPLQNADLIRSLYEARFGPLQAPTSAKEEAPAVAETEAPAEPKSTPEEPVAEEQKPKKKPFFVVRIPRWMKTAPQKPAAEAETEIAEAAPPAIEAEESPESETALAEAEIKIPTMEEMKAKLLDQIEVPESEILALAEKRMETVKQALLASDQLESDRISTGTATLDSGTQAKFELK